MNKIDVVNYHEEYHETKPSLFRESENIDRVLQAIFDVCDYQQKDFLWLSQNLLNIDEAVGFHLDLIGGLVGQPRFLSDFNTEPYFGYEGSYQSKPFSSITNPDVGGFWNSRSYFNTATARQLNDDEYRRLIKARAIYNQSNCTVNDLLEVINLLSNSRNNTVQMLNHGLIQINTDDSSGIISYFVDRLYLEDNILPIAAGVRIGLQKSVSEGSGDGDNGGKCKPVPSEWSNPITFDMVNHPNAGGYISVDFGSPDLDVGKPLRIATGVDLSVISTIEEFFAEVNNRGIYDDDVYHLGVRSNGDGSVSIRVENKDGYIPPDNASTVIYAAKQYSDFYEYDGTNIGNMAETQIDLTAAFSNPIIFSSCEYAVSDGGSGGETGCTPTSHNILYKSYWNNRVPSDGELHGRYRVNNGEWIDYTASTVGDKDYIFKFFASIRLPNGNGAIELSGNNTYSPFRSYLANEVLVGASTSKPLSYQQEGVVMPYSVTIEFEVTQNNFNDLVYLAFGESIIAKSCAIGAWVGL